MVTQWEAKRLQGTRPLLQQCSWQGQAAEQVTKNGLLYSWTVMVCILAHSGNRQEIGKREWNMLSCASLLSLISKIHSPACEGAKGPGKNFKIN